MPGQPPKLTAPSSGASLASCFARVVRPSLFSVGPLKDPAPSARSRLHCTKAPNCSSYVWHYNFAESAQYLGRERIGVEWLGEMDLDHFIIWAHHIWTDPKSGRLVREWKPWNGLQIYDPTGWTDAVEDPSVFETPPAACKKGGAKFRINCDDEGRYRPNLRTGPGV